MLPHFTFIEILVLMKFDSINVPSYLITFKVLVVINEMNSKVMTLFYKEIVVVFTK